MHFRAHPVRLVPTSTARADSPRPLAPQRAPRTSLRLRAFALAVLVGTFGSSASSCATTYDLTSSETSMQDAPTPVPEHAVYYLEIVTPDIEAASAFYADAYGWSFEPEAPELGNARVATLPDGSLCGIRAPMRATELPILRTYLRVADVEAATARAEELGAVIALGPTELPGRGKIAIFLLGGIEQGIWQVP